MTLEARLWILSITFFAAFVILGIFVSSHPPSRIDVAAGTFRGTSTGLAVLFTLSGRSLVLLGLGIVSLALFALLHRPLWIPIAIFISQVTSQGVVEGLKHVFARPRPDEWLIHREAGYSYPSGHATTAIVFFGAWLLVTLFLPIARPLKVVIAAALLVWMVGIDWSRMALSAHYFSDVTGGTLFGCAWMCALLALALRLRIPIGG